VKIVFMDNVGKGLTAGKDYVSVVSADSKYPPAKPGAL